MTYPTPSTDYIDTPWTDPATGTQWLWLVRGLSGKWIQYIPSGGVTTFAALTDAATADLPAINGPLGTALGGKAATSHTHTSADITDATSDATASVIVKRDASGFADFGNGVDRVVIGATEITHIHLPELGVNFSGSLNLSANLSATQAWYTPNASGTLALTSSTTGVPDHLAFGATAAEAVSMSSNAGTATFSFGANAQAAFRTAIGGTATGQSLFTAADVAAANAVFGSTRIVAASTDARTANSYANDSELSISGILPGTYQVDVFLRFTNASGANWTWRILCSSLIVSETTSDQIGNRQTGTSTLVLNPAASNPFALGGDALTVANGYVIAKMLITVTTGGTLAINTKNNTGTGTGTRLPGSYLLLTKLA